MVLREEYQEWAARVVEVAVAAAAVVGAAVSAELAVAFRVSVDPLELLKRSATACSFR